MFANKAENGGIRHFELRKTTSYRVWVKREPQTVN